MGSLEFGVGISELRRDCEAMRLQGNEVVKGDRVFFNSDRVFFDLAECFWNVTRCF